MTGSDGFDSGYSVDDSDQLQPEDMLLDEEVGDILDRGYSPPDYQPPGHEHDSLDSRLAEEEPDSGDPASDDPADPDYPEPEVAGGRRSGRLVSADEHSNDFGQDAGVDGGGASAEEAAVHIVE